jgi:hypothetical protein
VIDWGDERRERVRSILDGHPASSSACAAAAQKILPHALAVDPHSRALVIEPMRGFYVLPRNGLRWAHHVTVEVTRHRVDALTGVDGHPVKTYLDTYFQFPDELRVRPVDDDEWEDL